MLIDKAGIRRLIPHSGAMCLLDGVTFWNAETVECFARSHLAPDNPLSVGGRLLGVHLLEYGAQAVAVHGGLLAQAHARPFRHGYLAAIPEAHIYADTLETVHSELIVAASVLTQCDAGVVYAIGVSSEDRGALAEARVTIVFPEQDAAKR